MKLAILKAKDTENLQELPSNWPVECKEVADDYELTDTVNGRVLMTVEELKALKAENQSLYDAWHQSWLKDVIEPSQWLENRVKEYPSIGDQLDMLWHLMDMEIIQGKWQSFGENDTWFNTIKAVKDKYPKP